MRMQANGTGNGSTLTTASANTGDQQRFVIVSNSELSDPSTFRISPNVYAGGMLVDNGMSGTTCHLWSYTGASNQRWYFARAGAFTNEGMQTRTFTIRGVGTNARSLAMVWAAFMSTACASWNNSSANTNITYSTSNTTSPHTCSVENYGNTGWAAQTIKLSSGNAITSSEIRINIDLVGTEENVRKSTMTHEVGHLLGLEDNPPGVAANSSLMNSARTKSSVFTPQTFDVRNVLFRYT